MASAATELRISNLPKWHASALRRKAERMGPSPGDYVKQLIAGGLALDQKARSKSLEELASEERIARIVSRALSRRR